jgi:hypothetical protein
MFALENRGAVPVDRAVVTVVTEDPRLVGFVENESTHPRLRERDFGRLAPGIPSSAEFVTVDNDHDQEVTLLVTFRSGDDE